MVATRHCESRDEDFVPTYDLRRENGEGLSVILDSRRNIADVLPQDRGDGWKEAQMGEFFNEDGEDGSIFLNSPLIKKKPPSFPPHFHSRASFTLVSPNSHSKPISSAVTPPSIFSPTSPPFSLNLSLSPLPLSSAGRDSTTNSLSGLSLSLSPLLAAATPPSNLYLETHPPPATPLRSRPHPRLCTW
ncbi:hypothetical protein TIFTF001_031579 [Ficus carica]|uniref:Uncharacterized protein n=1 Tax=Ficus carica TaxID=3494 RepID=A0AA88DXG6_FICCA|nr:hypothetical protein TIFTF001_031579 [Ficus carica]